MSIHPDEPTETVDLGEAGQHVEGERTGAIMAFEAPDGYRWTSEPYGRLVPIASPSLFTRLRRAWRAFIAA